MPFIQGGEVADTKQGRNENHGGGDKNIGSAVLHRRHFS